MLYNLSYLKKASLNKLHIKINKQIYENTSYLLGPQTGTLDTVAVG
jgi:hypothetical protein